jgi:phage repressor protein C with HTH and peptisase S24 domain
VVESHNDQNFQSRLDQVLRQFASVAELARAVSVSDNAIYKWMSGRGQPSVANLVALARAARVSLEWLATGHETSDIEPNARSTTDRSDYVFVPRYDVKGPAARGGPLRSEQIVDHLAFKKDWVRSRLNTDPRNLLLIEAVGDSMSPTLEDGDLLLVDLGEPRFRHDGVYVLRRQHELAVKRVQRRPDETLLVGNDNPAYESAVATTDALRIVGRVIWASGRL